MLKDIKIEHHDGFGDLIIFWCEVHGVSPEIIEKAKLIDKENYNPNCFGVCVNFDSDGFYIVEDKPGHELYYIDNNGGKNYLDYKLSKKDSEEVFTACRVKICELLKD